MHDTCGLGATFGTPGLNTSGLVHKDSIIVGKEGHLVKVMESG